MNWPTFAAMLTIGIIVGISMTEFGRFAVGRRSLGWQIVFGVLVAALCVTVVWASNWPKDVFLGLLAGGVLGPVVWDSIGRVRRRHRSA
jgi:Na+/proline symporter